MSEQSNPIRVERCRAGAEIPARRFVTYSGALPAAGANTYGVAEYAAANGDMFAVATDGTAVVEAGAALTGDGLALETDASGRAVPQTTGKLAGRLMPGQVAQGAGQFVEIKLIPN